MNCQDFIESLPSASEVEAFEAEAESMCWIAPALTSDHLLTWKVGYQGSLEGLNYKSIFPAFFSINRALAAFTYLPPDQREGMTAKLWNKYIKEVCPLIERSDLSSSTLQRISGLLRIDRVDIQASKNEFGGEGLTDAVYRGMIMVIIHGWDRTKDEGLSFRRTSFDMIRLGDEWHIQQILTSTRTKS
jgi:hypothetical protein